MSDEEEVLVQDQEHELDHDENPRRRDAMDPPEAGTQQLIQRLLASPSAVQALGQALAPIIGQVHPGTQPRGPECLRTSASSAPGNVADHGPIKCPCRADHTHCRVYECLCRA